MAFPQTGRNIYVEMYLNGGWISVPSDVLQDPGITISGRGYRDESSQPQASSAEYVLKNTSGNWSIRNPLGAYYGSLGANTPCRLGFWTIMDLFSRTVSNGWGSTPTGQAWSQTGVGGSVLASDFNVNGSVATHSVPTTVAYRLSYLASVSYLDVEVVADVFLSFTDVTGGAIEPVNVLLRGQSVTNYYMVRVTVTASETVTIALMHYDGTSIAGAVTVGGLTHSSSQVLRVRAQAEGQTLRAKIWAAGGSEPFGWHVTGHSEQINASGWVGIRNGVASGNTNTKPIVFSIDNFTVRIPRYAGLLADVRPSWDISGNYATAAITMGSTLRRLGQGSAALQSSLRRALTSYAGTSVVAYWPGEDEAGSSRVSAAVGSYDMVVGGSPDFAANSDFAASKSILTLNLAVLNGFVDTYTPVSGGNMLRYLMSVPSGGVAADTIVILVTASGSIRRWDFMLSPAGDLAIRAYNSVGTLIQDSGFYAFAVNDSPRRFSLSITQNGANIDYTFATLQAGASVGSTASGTINSHTCGAIVNITVNPSATMDDVAIGHISVHRAVENLFSASFELAAWYGETAGNRLKRLCTEEAIEFAYWGDLDDTVAMGYQTPSALMTLLGECVDADRGLLYETRASEGLTYRPRRTLYGQSVRLSLNQPLFHLSEPFVPVDDDQQIKNDVTVSRTNGGSARVTVETGPMSILPPDQGGKGIYPAEVTVNTATDDPLVDLAGWIAHLGTVDESRFPQIGVALHRASIVLSGLEPSVMGVETGDRLTIANPKPTLAASTIDQLIVGYSESLTTFLHSLEFVGVPAAPYRVLELDSTGARLDSSTTTLTSGISNSATSFQVSISDGTLWSTDAADAPIPVTIGGEEMSVGAVSGASSPQTFATVTRSLNGIVKAHSSGAAVHVTNPVYLG